MNKVFLTSICLLLLTGCAGIYSLKHPSNSEEIYTFDGEERSFDVLDQSDDIGSQEIISFDQ